MQNRLIPVPLVRRTVSRPAGQSVAVLPPPAVWVRLLQAQRLAIMQSLYPMRQGELGVAYASRIRSLVAAYTTVAFAKTMRPAGAVSNFSSAKNAFLRKKTRAASGAGKEREKISYLASLAPSGKFESFKAVPIIPAGALPPSVFDMRKDAALAAMRTKMFGPSMKPAGDAFTDAVNNFETGGAWSATQPPTGTDTGLSATPIGVTTGSEVGNPPAGLNIYGWNAEGQPLDANGNLLSTSTPGGTTTYPVTTGTGGGGLTDAQITSLAGDVASILGTGAGIVNQVLRGQDAQAIAQIQADAQIRLQELRNQQATANPTQQAAINQQIATLNAALAQMAQHQGLSTGTMVALGVGAVALVGIALLASRPRHNPVLYRKSHRHSGLEPWKYVSAKHLGRR